MLGYGDIKEVSNVIQFINESFPDAKLAGWTGPGWYFWDEIWCHCYGPYETEEVAIANVKVYLNHLSQKVRSK